MRIVAGIRVRDSRTGECGTVRSLSPLKRNALVRFDDVGEEIGHAAYVRVAFLVSTRRPEPAARSTPSTAAGHASGRAELVKARRSRSLADPGYVYAELAPGPGDTGAGGAAADAAPDAAALRGAVLG